MTRRLTDTLTEAERLLRAKKYSEAFDKLRAVTSSSIKSEQLGEYCLLMSEAALHVGEYSAVCIDKALEIYRRGDTERFARAKFLKGWYLALQGQFAVARETLQEAYAHCLRCDNLHDAARVLNRLSFVTHHSGHIEGSIENLKKCLQIYDQLGDRAKMVQAAHNLAYVYFAAGRLRESLSIYETYPVTVAQNGEKPVLNFYFMSAVPHALKGDIKTAKSTIAKCEPYLAKYIRERAIYCENLGLISLLDRDFSASEQALHRGLEISLNVAPQSALVSQIKRLLADVYIATARYELAERSATQALAVAEKINERVEIAACWRVLAQIETHRHNETKARQWFQKALDWFKQIGARYELAVTRFLAATSGLYYDGERTALLYLAREYFEAEDVAHYVDKIDTQLNRIALPRKPVNISGEVGPAIIAVSAEMKKKVAFARHIAGSEMTVLLTGETGTGKDLLARYIHHWSGREGEFVAVNAAAIPVSMIESELFGYKQGSFTGAHKDRPGLFEQADGGTFYLDEIADASPELQAKLLRVLETRRVRRLGENKDRPIFFRLIAATNHDLHQRMTDNRFRQDLYHRLNEVQIELTPLRQHPEDIPPLVEHFLTFAGFDLTRNGNQRDLERLGAILSQRSWSGNVRQLRAEIQHLWLMSRGDLSRMIDLALEREGTSESEHLLEVLLRTNWNRRQAARIMGVSEGTVRNRIKKYNLKREAPIS